MLLCVMPLAAVMRPAFDTDPTNIVDILLSSRNQGIILFTAVQASISAILTVVIALPGAYLLARYDFPGRSVLMSLTTVPFVVPPLVLCVGFLALFGSQGYINHALAGAQDGGPVLSILYTPYAIVLAHVFLNFPVALRILHSRFTTIDGSLSRASEVAGAGPVRTFFRTTLPQMRFSIMAAASLVFTFCFLSFGVVLVIGGMTNATIEVEIFRQLSGGNDVVSAAVLLMVQTLVLIVAAALYVVFSRAEERSGAARGKGIEPGKRIGIPMGFMTVLYVIGIALLVIGPIVAVGIASFHIGARPEGTWTLDNFRTVISHEGDGSIGATPIQAIRNSLLFAVIATCVTVPLSILAAYLIDSRHFRGKTALDVILIFPIGTSAIALGYGLASGDLGSMLSGTWAIVVLVHTLLAYPFCTRAVMSAKRDLSLSLLRSSEVMGASRARTFKEVDLPALLPGIAVASAFAFAISLGEFGATYMVFSPEYATMPVALYQFISGGRDLGAVAAYSVVLMAVTVVSIFAVDVGVRGLGKVVRWL